MCVSVCVWGGGRGGSSSSLLDTISAAVHQQLRFTG